MAGQTGKIKSTITLLIAMLSLASYPVMAQEETSPTLNLDGWPEWLLESMAKENLGLEPTLIELPTRGIVLPLVGKPIGEPTDTGNGWYVNSDIGTATPMECWVFTEIIDPASTVLQIADMSMGAVAQSNGAIADQFNYYLDAGVIGSSRYFAFEKIYTAGESGALVVGLTKVRLAAVDDIFVACGHNEIGYRETFARGFERLVLELKLERSSEQPFLREIVRTKFGDQVVSLLELTFRIDSDGDLATAIIESMLVPVDAETVSSSDSYSYSFWTPEGDLISDRNVSAENGEIAMNIDLLPIEGGGYSATGVFQGKEIEYTFDGSEKIYSDMNLMLQTQELLADNERESLTTFSWEPAIDPTGFIPVTMTLQPGGRAERRVVVSLGPVEMQAQLDKFGSLTSASFALGPNNVSMERMLIEGDSPSIEAND